MMASCGLLCHGIAAFRPCFQPAHDLSERTEKNPSLTASQPNFACLFGCRPRRRLLRIPTFHGSGPFLCLSGLLQAPVHDLHLPSAAEESRAPSELWGSRRALRAGLCGSSVRQRRPLPSDQGLKTREKKARVAAFFEGSSPRPRLLPAAARSGPAVRHSKASGTGRRASSSPYGRPNSSISKTTQPSAQISAAGP